MSSVPTQGRESVSKAVNVFLCINEKDGGNRDVVAVVLLIITGGVVVWQVLIPHDGDGSAWWSGVYTDRQVEETVQESVWGVEIFLLDSGLGKERPERPIRVLLVEAKRYCYNCQEYEYFLSSAGFHFEFAGLLHSNTPASTDRLTRTKVPSSSQAPEQSFGTKLPSTSQSAIKQCTEFPSPRLLWRLPSEFVQHPVPDTRNPRYFDTNRDDGIRRLPQCPIQGIGHAHAVAALLHVSVCGYP